MNHTRYPDRNKDSAGSIIQGENYNKLGNCSTNSRSGSLNKKPMQSSKSPTSSGHHFHDKNSSNQNNPTMNDHSRSEHGYPLSPEDLKRQKIAHENYDFFKKNPQFIDKNIETYYDDPPSHINGAKSHKEIVLRKPLNKKTPVLVKSQSTIGAAIESYKINSNAKICILNFANATKPGGGYLNGRSAQEESLCRQTLLYPTIDGNYMYKFNEGKEKNGTDAMIYSPNVLVIRDDQLELIKNKYPNFRVNVITSPAVDIRKGKPQNYKEMMKQRIIKIIKLAAFKGNDVLILGAFGCGVFNNDPKEVSQIFKEVLIDDNLKNYFDAVIFPIHQNSANFKPFQSTLQFK